MLKLLGLVGIALSTSVVFAETSTEEAMNPENMPKDMITTQTTNDPFFTTTGMVV